jgi:hypothetical protein
MPGRLIFHVIKIGRNARAGKATAMENGLKMTLKQSCFYKLLLLKT